MKRTLTFLPIILFTSFALAQHAPSGPPLAPQSVQPNSALIVEGIPPVPTSIAQQADRYTQVRGAAFLDWNPTKREMLINTRFGDVPQVHRVAAPGADRTH